MKYHILLHSIEQIKSLDCKSKLMFRPLSIEDIENNLTDDISEADLIIIPSTAGNSCNNYLSSLSVDPKYYKKMVIYANDDNPGFLYNNSTISKFIAQPLTSSLSPYKNITIIPLVMSDHSFINRSFIDKCRNRGKKFDFCFIGNMSYKNRSIIDIVSKLPELKYYKFNIINSPGFYSIQDQELKIQHLKNYLLNLSQSRFVFAPRGEGSCSFRFYESMMVGSIPIEWGSVLLPKELNRNSYIKCNFDTIDSLRCAIFEAVNIRNYQSRYINYRQNGMNYWDNYCEPTKLNNYIKVKAYENSLN